MIVDERDLRRWAWIPEKQGAQNRVHKFIIRFEPAF